MEEARRAAMNTQEQSRLLDRLVDPDVEPQVTRLYALETRAFAVDDRDRFGCADGEAPASLYPRRAQIQKDSTVIDLARIEVGQDFVALVPVRLGGNRCARRARRESSRP